MDNDYIFVGGMRMTLDRGDFVNFDGKTYRVFWIYENGNLEIETNERLPQMKLVHEDDVSVKLPENC